MHVVDLDAHHRVIITTPYSKRKGHVDEALPFVLLEDLFECVTMDVCARLFDFLESRIGVMSKVRLAIDRT